MEIVYGILALGFLILAGKDPFIAFILAMIILFVGEPDIHDALINYLMK